MLTTFDRYLVRSFLTSFAILLVVGFGLVILLDLLFNLDEFTDDGRIPLRTSLPMVVDYYLYRLPLYFFQLAPPVMTMAGAFTLGSVLRNNELTPLLAAGIPLWRLTVPLCVCAAIVVPMCVFNREVTLPFVAPKVARKHNDAVGSRVQRARCIRDERGATLSAQQLEVQPGRLTNPYLIEPAGADGAVGLVQADVARWDAPQQIWRLERGTRTLVGGMGREQLAAQPIDILPFRLSPEQLQLRQSAEWSDLLSTRQLKRLASQRALPNHSTVVQALVLRFTEPVGYVLLLALAIPAFLMRERRNVFAAAGTALLWSGAFFAVSQISREFVTDVKSAQLAAGLPIIVFGPLALLQLMNLKT